MGIQINGQNDNISATDGGLTISDLEINQSGISTFNGSVIINEKIRINPDDASTTWQRENKNLHQIRDDVYVEGTVNLGDKAGFDATPLGITTFAYTGIGTTGELTVGIATTTHTPTAHAIAEGKNILIKDSASGFQEAFNTLTGSTGLTIKVARASDPSSQLSIANTKVVVYTPADPRGCLNVAKDYAKFEENTFNPILRGFVGASTTHPVGINTEVFKIQLKRDSSAQDSVATLLHSTREMGSKQRLALTIDDGDSYPDGKSLVLTQTGVKITNLDDFTNARTLLEVQGELTLTPESNVAEAIRIAPAVDASSQQEFGIGLAVNANHTHPAAKITFKEFDASDSRGDLLFYTRGVNSDSAPTERLRIDSSGQLGVGTQSPNELLHVSGNSSGAISAKIENTYSSDATRFAILELKSGVGSVRFHDQGDTIEGEIKYDTTTNSMRFATNGNSERLRIDSSGRVLIGTTTEGNANADDLTIANSGEGGITIRSGSSSNGNIFFSDATSGAGEYAGYIDYKHGSDIMTFGIGGGTEYFRIGASGDYGTVETRSAKNGWGGYGIVNGASYVFMGDSTQVGIYNDTDNEWMLTATKNGDTFLYSNGAQTLRSYTTGDYGTIQTLASKNGWGGYSVNGQYVFMADGSNAGIYNDIDNEWLMYCTRNGGFNLYHNNTLYLNSSGGYLHMVQDGRLESKPNSTWGAGFYFGGNGQAASSTHASCVVTNGNIHIDARNGSYGTYLNWYSGGNGIYFGNAASGQAGRIDSSGNMTVSGGYSGSDLRLKENIKNITGATDLIKSLVGKTYTWKKGIGLDDWNHYGLVAQEVQKVAPDLVRDNGSQFFDKDDNLVKEFDPTESDEDRKNKGLNQSLTVNYEGVTPILVEAMKELIAKVETLEAEVAALKSP